MFAALILTAWLLEALVGWPKWLFARVRHPVVWMGSLISFLEKRLNRPSQPHKARYMLGMVASLSVVSLSIAIARAIEVFTPSTLWGTAVEVVVASSLLASRSLYEHVAAVAKPLIAGDIAAARISVSTIVGRDPNQLDEAGIARASLESLAENASDGVTAPLFWGVLFGLPGMAGYKAINTLDSMIGHRTERYAAFGGFAARLDDVANLIPARLTALFIFAVRFRPHALRIICKDARNHRSPNAGWPEAAMATALTVRLSGPRRYGERIAPEPWLNAAAPDPTPSKVREGLRLYWQAMGLMAGALSLIAIWGAMV